MIYSSVIKSLHYIVVIFSYNVSRSVVKSNRLEHYYNKLSCDSNSLNIKKFEVINSDFGIFLLVFFFEVRFNC